MCYSVYVCVYIYIYNVYMNNNNNNNDNNNNSNNNNKLYILTGYSICNIYLDGRGPAPPQPLPGRPQGAVHA